MGSELAVGSLQVGEAKMSGLKPTNANGRRRARTASPAVRLPKWKRTEKRVWSYDKLVREMGRARRIGLTKIDNDYLLNLAEGAYGVYKRCVVDISDVVIEVWRRIENDDMPEVNNSKTQFCRRLGCTLRWGELIVKGDARDPNRGKARERWGAVNSPDLELPVGTPEDIAIECLDWVFRKLRPLREHDDPRYQDALRIMWPAIKEASEMKNPRTQTVRDAVAD
jgi:hypothetical protein